jgi:hypothetical protein
VATFRRSLDDDEHETFSLANDVVHCHDHQGHRQDDRHQDHQGHRQDDQHLDHQNRHQDDQHLGHPGDQGHSDDRHLGHPVRVFLDPMDALGHLFQLDRDQEHLQEYDPYARQHQDHQGDQHLVHLDDRPLVDDQHQERHQGGQEVVELVDRYLEVAESDGQMGLLEEAAEGVVLSVQMMQQLVQQTVRLVRPVQVARVQAQQVQQELVLEQEQGQLCQLVAQK